MNERDEQIEEAAGQFRAGLYALKRGDKDRVFRCVKGLVRSLARFGESVERERETG